MASIKIPTTFNIDVEFEVPEFYRRLLALIIDFVVQYIYLRIGVSLIDSMRSGQNIIESYYTVATLYLLLWIPVILYHVTLEISLNGQSIGKKIMGIRVVNENGGRASISQFLIRWLLRVSDTWMVILFFLLLQSAENGDNSNTFILLVGFGFLIADIILVIATPKGQRIGDVLARTILIRTHSKSSIEETVFQEVSSDYQPVYPAIMQLSDKDINAIKTILGTARRKNDWTIAESAAHKIRTHLQIETQQDPIDFLDTLLKDYNYLSVK
ncbi:MAG: RDD family protein [Sphingobacteriales bacterium]|jgi:uncharacterized RDD family membrane protein YckC|nr:RDD family protein [Sphingobacteriales bacterium]NCT76157.1 RDD family protein [Chitinophagaceae bacterium]OJW36814.1 MAG: hypothetical protein BGO54_06845 [Sphingobacteriales bacterium 46-32]